MNAIATLGAGVVGADNVSPADRLPKGYARELVNLEATPGGQLALRPGYRRLIECAACRGAFALGRRLVIADGARLLAFDRDTAALAELSASLPAGLLAGGLQNGQLYLCTSSGQYRTDGATLRRWDVPAPVFTAAALPGGSLAGQYKVAVTALGEEGEESGAVPVAVTLDGGRLQVLCNDPRPLRLYVSPPNAATLYYQGRIVGGVALIEAPTDSGARLTTAHLEPMPPCEQLVGHHGVLVGAVGSYVFLSESMYPHLTSLDTRFFQFPGEVQALAATDGGVFVALADRTYFLTGIETEQPLQRLVDHIGALAGSAVSLPDGSAAWFGRHGLVVGAPDGSLQLPSRERHAPALAESGAACVLESNGVRRVIVRPQGELRANPRAVGEGAAPDGLAYAVSLETGGVATYGGYDFAGFAGAAGEAFGWRADGVYQLGQPVPEDQPIDARVDFGATGFGSAVQKRLLTAWAQLDTDAQATLLLCADGGDEHRYVLQATRGTRKTPLAKGVLGRSWRVTLELIEAGNATLDGVEIEVSALQRRIR